jgi:hypothetical protein
MLPILIKMCAKVRRAEVNWGIGRLGIGFLRKSEIGHSVELHGHKSGQDVQIYVQITEHFYQLLAQIGHFYANCGQIWS